MKIRRWYEFGDDIASRGVRPLDEPGADFVSAWSIPHDHIEHFDDIPISFGVAGEMAAFGSMLCLRWMSGWHAAAGIWTKYNTYTDWVKDEMVDIMQHHFGEGMELPYCTMRMRQKSAIDEAELSHQLQDWESTLVPYLMDEEHAEMRHGAEEKEVREFIRKCKGWVRYGARRFSNRYSEMDNYGYCECVYKFIQDSVAELMTEQVIEMGEWHRMSITTDTRGEDVLIKLYQRDSRYGLNLIETRKNY
jgi:hypothetical protein